MFALPEDVFFQQPPQQTPTTNNPNGGNSYSTSNGGNQQSGQLSNGYQFLTPVEDGTVTLNGFTYDLKNHTINGTRYNIKLGVNNNVLYYGDNSGGWIKYEGSNTQKLLEGSVTQQQTTNPVNPLQVTNSVNVVEQIVNPINQVQQVVSNDRPVDVSHLTMQKFPEKKTLFENPLLIFGLAAIGIAIFNIKN